MAATREDWIAEPMSAQRVRLAINRRFSQAGWELLRTGFVPRDMDDKWFVYLEGDRLCFHRAWTGICYFEARIEDCDGAVRMVEVWVNRDRRQVEVVDAHGQESVALLNRIIDRVLLERDEFAPTDAAK